MASTAVKVTYDEGSAPSTPAANKVVTYAKADGLMYSKDDAGVETLMSGGSGSGMATDPLWDAAGDLAQGTGANTGAKLSAGTAGQFLKSGGAATANAWASRELDYAEVTSSVTLTGTSEGAADTIVTGNAVTYDGSTAVMIEFWCYTTATDANQSVVFVLLEGATVVGIAQISCPNGATSANRLPGTLQVRRTPAAGSKTMTLKAWKTGGTAIVGAGAGGSGTGLPAYLRITRAL